MVLNIKDEFETIVCNNETIYGYCKTIEGNDNIIHGDAICVIGNGNIIHGNVCEIYGNLNKLQNSQDVDIVVGNDNEIHCNVWGYVEGNGNCILGGTKLIKGTNNNIYGGFLCVVGNDNIYHHDDFNDYTHICKDNIHVFFKGRDSRLSISKNTVKTSTRTVNFDDMVSPFKPKTKKKILYLKTVKNNNDI
jgi:hypothetical protein